MATYENVRTTSKIAGSAVTIYRFVVIAADGKYDHVGTAQARADGVCAETVAAEDDCFPMAHLDGGELKVEAGAAIAAGDKIGSDATGKAITYVDSATNVCLGTATMAATADGDIITIQGGPVTTNAG